MDDQMSVEKWMASASSASERNSRAVRWRLRARVKSTVMDRSRTRNGQMEKASARCSRKNEAANGFGHDPYAGGEHEAGFYKRRKALDLAMAVVVLLIGGTVGYLDREERDCSSDEVYGRVRRLGEHAQRSGEDARDEFKCCDEKRREHGEERGRALGGASIPIRPAGRIACGRRAHGRDGTGWRGKMRSESPRTLVRFMAPPRRPPR